MTDPHVRAVWADVRFYIRMWRYFTARILQSVLELIRTWRHR